MNESFIKVRNLYIATDNIVGAWKAEDTLTVHLKTPQDGKSSHEFRGDDAHEVEAWLNHYTKEVAPRRKPGWGKA